MSQQTEEVYRSGQKKGLPKRCECGGLLVYVFSHERIFSHCGRCTPVVEGYGTRTLKLRRVRRTEPQISRDLWHPTCPVCKGWGELPDAVQAWDEAHAPVPRCPYCRDGRVDLTKLLTPS